MEKFISLYDYLGRAAGRELGEAVAKAARNRNIPMEKRIIKNPQYQGYVHLYPEYWLEGYFKHNLHPTTSNIIEEIELPF